MNWMHWHRGEVPDLGVVGMDTIDITQTRLDTRLCEQCQVRWYGMPDEPCWCCGQPTTTERTQP